MGPRALAQRARSGPRPPGRRPISAAIVPGLTTSLDRLEGLTVASPRAVQAADVGACPQGCNKRASCRASGVMR